MVRTTYFLTFLGFMSAGLVACSNANPSSTSNGTGGSGGEDTGGGGSAQPTTIGPMGGTVIGEGITLEIPAGALTADTDIVVQPISPATVDGVTLVTPLFELKPAGTVFAKPITATFTLSGQPQVDSLLAVLTKYGDTSQYETVGLTVDDQKVSARFDHFSAIAIANPAAPSTFIAAPGTRRVIASGGTANTCAITPTGTVKCWGARPFGAVKIQDAPTPTATLVPDVSNAVEVSTMVYGACALVLNAPEDTSGGIKCWGRSDASGGFLPQYTNETPDPLPPTLVPGFESNIISMASRKWVLCGITSTGGVKCAGSAFLYGEIGNGSSGSAATAQDVIDASGTPITGIKQVEVGYYTTCALTTAGGVMCWGSLPWMGPNATSYHASPVPGLSTGVEWIGMTTDAPAGLCAGFTTGEVKCLGGNKGGQFGIGSTSMNVSTPTPVPNLTNASRMLDGACWEKTTTIGDVTSSDIWCAGNANGVHTWLPEAKLTATLLPNVKGSRVTVGQEYICAMSDPPASTITCFGNGEDTGAFSLTVGQPSGTPITVPNFP
jgi:hypothetical protein